MDMRGWVGGLVLVAASLMPAVPGWGQQYSADKPLGTAAQAPPAFLKKAGIDQNLGKPLPLNDRFLDSSGTEAPLSAYFTHRPVVMALVYYKCKMLCPQVLSGLAKTLRSVGFTPGKDYDVVITSIDPMDTPADGAAEKTRFLESLGAPGAGGAVHFLTGHQGSITRSRFRYWVQLCSRAGAGWEDGPVCPFQRDYDRYSGWSDVEVSFRD